MARRAGRQPPVAFRQPVEYQVGHGAGGHAARRLGRRLGPCDRVSRVGQVRVDQVAVGAAGRCGSYLAAFGPYAEIVALAPDANVGLPRGLVSAEIWDANLAAFFWGSHARSVP